MEGPATSGSSAAFASGAGTEMSTTAPVLLVFFSPVVSGKGLVDGVNQSLLPTSIDISWFPLENPGIVSIPLGFIGCWLGTVLSSERGGERSFNELYVLSETGLGAEKSSVHS